MFDDEPVEGAGVPWQAPQGAQRPKPRKLTGPWGEYSGATVATAPKAPKKRPGECRLADTVVTALAGCMPNRVQNSAAGPQGLRQSPLMHAM